MKHGYDVIADDSAPFSHIQAELVININPLCKRSLRACADNPAADLKSTCLSRGGRYSNVYEGNGGQQVDPFSRLELLSKTGMLQHIVAPH